MPLLVNDIGAVIKAEGRDSAVIVGHDWGGAVAWSLAMTHPEWLQALIILNLPHPSGIQPSGCGGGSDDYGERRPVTSATRRA